MGAVVNISCAECGYEKEFGLGVGMHYFSENQYLEVMHPAIRKRIEPMLRDHAIGANRNCFTLFHCSNCHKLYARFYVEIVYKDRENEQKIFRSRHFCSKCDTELMAVNVDEAVEEETTH